MFATLCNVSVFLKIYPDFNINYSNFFFIVIVRIYSREMALKLMIKFTFTRSKIKISSKFSFNNNMKRCGIRINFFTTKVFKKIKVLLIKKRLSINFNIKFSEMCKFFLNFLINKNCSRLF